MTDIEQIDPYAMGRVLLAVKQAEDEFNEGFTEDEFPGITEDEMQMRISAFTAEDELDALRIGDRIKEAIESGELDEPA